MGILGKLFGSLTSESETKVEDGLTFYMPIDDVFSISGHGTVVTGIVEAGTIKVGNHVEIAGGGRPPVRAKIEGIERVGKAVDKAGAGDDIGCILQGATEHRIKRGQVLVTPGTYNGSIPNATLNFELLDAAQKGDTREVQALLAKGADVNAKEGDGTTALIAAAFGGHTETVKALLAGDADIDAKGYKGGTALMVAAGKGHLKTVQVLLAKDANVNEKHHRGRCALDFAVLKGQAEIVRALLSKGADVNNKDMVGGTALITAAEAGHTEIVQLLLAKGADVNAKSEDGVTALMCAEEEGHTEIIQLLNQYATMALQDYELG